MVIISTYLTQSRPFQIPEDSILFFVLKKSSTTIYKFSIHTKFLIQRTSGTVIGTKYLEIKVPERHCNS